MVVSTTKSTLPRQNKSTAKAKRTRTTQLQSATEEGSGDDRMVTTAKKKKQETTQTEKANTDRQYGDDLGVLGGGAY